MHVNLSDIFIMKHTASGNCFIHRVQTMQADRCLIVYVIETERKRINNKHDTHVRT